MHQADADRNLLFGILALQMDFITRDALIAGMNAWVLDKAKPLGQILREQNVLADDEHVLLDALARKHMEKHGGDPRESLAAVTPIGTARQDLAEIADPDIDASLPLVSAGRADEDPYATRLASVGRSSSSGTRFTILRPHAKGGLGVVHIARDEELNREVALKEIQDRHADDPVSQARFLLEAEITGGLEHPGIVPVYGLGHYGDGRPFYAMRFIRGSSLRDEIRRFHRMEGPQHGTGERAVELQKLLRRFLDVCNAMDYAHSRGVLHRDLKPGNIMVGRYGETLVVDWGLAKATHRPEIGGGAEEPPLTPSSASGTAETLPGSAVGTPQYMSPEQAAGRLDRLGPASDVYSLGATLYELITGRAPFEEAVGAGDSIQRVQRGDFPPPRRLDPTISPRLEAICLKAMALDPAGRYVTPRAMADDVEHWLADEPVSAYREGWGPRLARWSRRHRAWAQAGAAALVLVAVVAVVAAFLVDGSRRRATRFAEAVDRANERLNGANENLKRALIQARQNANEAEAARVDAARSEERASQDNKRLRSALAEIERRRAEADRAHREAEAAGARARAVDDFLLNDLLAQASPEHNARDRKVTVEEALDRAAARVGTAFPGQPAVQAEVRRTIADTYHGLGAYAKSEGQYREAAESSKVAEGAEHPNTLEAMRGLGHVLHHQNKLEQAEAILRRVVEARGRVSGPEGSRTLIAIDDLAQVLHHRGKWDEAEVLFRQELEIERRVHGASRPALGIVLNNLGLLVADRGRSEEAVPLLREALDNHHKLLGDEHPHTLTAMANLGRTLSDEGELDEGERLLRRALKAQERVLGLEHPYLAYTLHSLAGVVKASGHPDEAERFYRRALECHQRSLGAEQPETLTTLNALGRLLMKRGEIEEAESLLRNALESRRRVSGEEHRDTLTVMDNLAQVLRHRGKLDEAEALFRRTLDLRRRTLGERDTDTAITMNNLALVHEERGRLDDAESLLRQSFEISRAARGLKHPETGIAMNNLTRVLRALGRPGEADMLDLRRIESLRRDPGPESPEALVAMNHLALAFLDAGRAAEAEPLLREVLRSRRKAKPQNSLGIANAASSLGWALTTTGKTREAEPLLREALEIRRERIKGHWVEAQTKNLLGHCLGIEGRFDEAEPHLLASVEALKSAPQAPPRRVRQAIERVVGFYESWGRRSRAEEWRARLLDLGFPADPFTP